MLKIYVAHAMTGRTGAELLRESDLAARFAAVYAPGSKVLDPVVMEGVTEDDKRLANPDDRLATYWRSDKAAIREAHILIDLSGPAKSEGVAHEIGYARFCLWKPVVRVWPGLGPSIARFEDDLVVDQQWQAFALAFQGWGTWQKRFVWRAKMLARCLPKWLRYQLEEFK